MASEKAIEAAARAHGEYICRIFPAATAYDELDDEARKLARKAATHALTAASAIDGDAQFNEGVDKAIGMVKQAAAMEDAGYGHDFVKLLAELEKLKKVTP